MEIAVVSGKGGTGKSSITAALASLSHKLVTVDCDVDAANMYLLFNPKIEKSWPFIAGIYGYIDQEACIECGKCADLCCFDAIKIDDGNYHIDPIACDGCRLCERECPVGAIKMIENNKSRMYECSFKYGKMVYGRLAPGEDNSGKFVSVLREKAEEVAKSEHLDLRLLDGPPGIGCPVISTLTGIDRVVIVTEPTLSGLSDLRRIIEVARTFTNDIFVIINKCDLNEDMTQKISKECDAIGIVSTFQLPFNKDMVDAMVLGQSIVEYAPDSILSKELELIAQQVLPK